jgi:hypothetical protein
MTTRSRRETVHFKHPFQIKGVDRLLPPGAYEVSTDEEMIEGLSFSGLPPRRHHDHGSRGSAAPFLNGNDLHQFGRSLRCTAQRRERIS